LRNVPRNGLCARTSTVARETGSERLLVTACGAMWRMRVSNSRSPRPRIRCGFAPRCGGCGGCGGLRHIEGAPVFRKVGRRLRGGGAGAAGRRRSRKAKARPRRRQEDDDLREHAEPRSVCVSGYDMLTPRDSRVWWTKFEHDPDSECGDRGTHTSMTLSFRFGRSIRTPIRASSSRRTSSPRRRRRSHSGSS
jgi:hypothetical protein